MCNSGQCAVSNKYWTFCSAASGGRVNRCGKGGGTVRMLPVVRLLASVCEIVLSESRKVPNPTVVAASVPSRRRVRITPYAGFPVCGRRI